MSVKTNGDNWGLALLADFMNTAVGSATDRQWRAFTKKAFAMRIGDRFLDRMGLPEVIAARCEIHDALSFLRLDARRLKKIGNPYLLLTEKLSDLQMPTCYQCMELKKGRAPRPGQALLRSRDKRRWICLSYPAAHGAREWLYTLLSGALTRGALNHLKVCRQCGKYIVVRDIKREFCEGKNCKIDYFNKLTTGSRARNRKRAGATTAPRKETVYRDCGCSTDWLDGVLIREQPCEQCEARRRQRLRPAQ